MLNAREIRVERQSKMLLNGKCIICFTMNIAGPYKISSVIEKAFDEGMNRIVSMLKVYRIAPLQTNVYKEITGVEGYISVNADSDKIKRLMVQIEDTFPLGRLFDIDVIKSNGEKVSRSDINMAGRRCMICESEGAACARSRKHSVEELQQHFIDTICNHFNNEYADFLAQQAVKSLLYEVAVTPKPGLVDRIDNGAHRDMDFYTFIDSAVCLYDYFKKCALIAIEESELSLNQIFEKLRYLGISAEEKMYNNTNGVNTHKGAVFSFGLTVASAAYLYENSEKITIDNVLDTCAKMAKYSLADFENQDEHMSFGKKAFAKHNVKGARGQAAAGYPDVKTAFMFLRECILKGDDVNTAGAKTLCLLMTLVEDTNIIKRSDIQTLKKVQTVAKQILNKEDVVLSINQLNQEFIKQNISPGGCADLLAMCFLLNFICE